jgi:hypothetical protein
MEELEFIYDEKRSCEKCLLFTKCIFCIFHFVSLIHCFTHIEITIIGYYFNTLLAIFICICNNIRYEYVYIKNKGKIFPSYNVFLAWKKEVKMPRITYGLECIEILVHIVFFIQSWSITVEPFEKNECLLYRVSFVFLYTYTIAILFMWCCVCICVCTLNVSQHRLFTSQPMLTNIIIDEQKECCICMDCNTKEWIETPCVHSFHRECLNGSTQTNRTCLICRNSL